MDAEFVSVLELGETDFLLNHLMETIRMSKNYQVRKYYLHSIPIFRQERDMKPGRFHRHSSFKARNCLSNA